MKQASVVRLQPRPGDSPLVLTAEELAVYDRHAALQALQEGGHEMPIRFALGQTVGGKPDLEATARWLEAMPDNVGPAEVMDVAFRESAPAVIAVAFELLRDDSWATDDAVEVLLKRGDQALLQTYLPLLATRLQYPDTVIERLLAGGALQAFELATQHCDPHKVDGAEEVLGEAVWKLGEALNAVRGKVREQPPEPLGEARQLLDQPPAGVKPAALEALHLALAFVRLAQAYAVRVEASRPAKA